MGSRSLEMYVSLWSGSGGVKKGTDPNRDAFLEGGRAFVIVTRSKTRNNELLEGATRYKKKRIPVPPIKSTTTAKTHSEEEP